VEFGLLGPLLVTGAGTDQPSLSAKQRVLFAVLLLRAGRIVPMDELIDLMWDGDPPARARASLHNHVLALRRALGHAVGARIHTRTPGYVIEVQPGELDLARFTEQREQGQAALDAGDYDRAAALLRAALAQWRGEPLVDVPSEALHREAAHLAQLRTETLQSRIDADLHRGQHDRLITELSRLVTEHPLRERLHAQLMLAQYRAGRQAEALNTYEQARRVLAAELGVDPGAALRELHERILRADPSLLLVPPTEAAPRPRLAPPPAALPADLADFTGRDDVVRHLRDLLTSTIDGDQVGVVSVSAVAGAGGIGKTALAVHAAHQVRQRFPDGQLYVDLRGASTAPVDPADALGRLLRDLGTAADAVPADIDERAARYRSALAGKRMLVVLDDAAGAEQVRPLIPGDRGCCVLVTSRPLLTDLAGAHHLSLDVLSEQDAAELFAQIVGRARAAAEPAATAQVLAACGGLPLAIRIAGSRLASRPQWTIQHLADRLADEHGRLSELAAGDVAVRACFQLSYTNLETRPDHKRLEPARAFRLLGMIGGPDISLPAAAALIGRPADDAERALELLVDMHLLGTPVPGRYKFHDLIRMVAAERAEDEETEQQRTAAAHRLLNWYLHTAYAAGRVIAPLVHAPPLDQPEPAIPPLAFADRDHAVTWCDTEAANLALAIRMAADLGLHELVVLLASSQRGFFYLRKPLHDWITAMRLGVASAKALGDRLSEFRMTSNQGIALQNARRYTEAIEQLGQALQISRELGLAAPECATLANLATCYSELGQYGVAIYHQSRSLAMAKELGNRNYMAVNLNNLGEHYRSVDELDESLSYLQQALAIKRELRDDYTMSSTLDGIARTYLAMHRYAEASDHAQQAIALRTEMDDKWGLAESLDRLATALQGLGRPTEARAHWQRAMAIYDELGATQADEIRARLDTNQQPPEEPDPEPSVTATEEGTRRSPNEHK
jgi:DNA-binding SARP family transcriptional activator